MTSSPHDNQHILHKACQQRQRPYDEKSLCHCVIKPCHHDIASFSRYVVIPLPIQNGRARLITLLFVSALDTPPPTVVPTRIRVGVVRLVISPCLATTFRAWAELPGVTNEPIHLSHPF